MPEQEQKSLGSTDIPFLFYDLIGRGYPGGFLVVGMAISFQHFWPFYYVDCVLNKVQLSEHFLALATLGLGLFAVFFVLTSIFLGFILGALSKAVVEHGLWRRFGDPLGEKQLKEFLGLEQTTLLEQTFIEQFGSKYEEIDKSLNRASFLCSYYIWRANPTLGTMQGRWDCDLLAAQSTFLVALVLLIVSALQLCIVGSDLFQMGWIALLVIILFGAGLNFNYHRKKRVFDRFAVFLALRNPNNSPSRKFE